MTNFKCSILHNSIIYLMLCANNRTSGGRCCVCSGGSRAPFVIASASLQLLPPLCLVALLLAWCPPEQHASLTFTWVFFLTSSSLLKQKILHSLHATFRFLYHLTICILFCHINHLVCNVYVRYYRLCFCR